MVDGEGAGHVPGRPVPRHAVVRPIPQGRLRDRPAVRGVGRAVEREFHRRASGAGLPHPLDGDVDALRPQHPRHDRDPERRRRRQGTGGEGLGIDARAADQGDGGVGRVEAERAGIVRVLEQEAGLPARQRAADQTFQRQPREPSGRVLARAEQAEAGQREDAAGNAGHRRRCAADEDAAQRDAVDDIGAQGLEDARELACRVARGHRVEAGALRLQRHDADAGRLDHGAVRAHPRHHRDREPHPQGGAGHRQEVRGEEPVLGHHEDEALAGQALAGTGLG